MQIDVQKYPEHNAIGDLIRDLMPTAFLDTVMPYVAATLGLVTFVSLSAFFLIWLERKICAHFQARLGPMRVGWHGALQTIADAVKLLLKEGLKPKGADSFGFYLAPLLPMTATFLVLVVIPFDHHLQITDLNVGVLYVIAVSGLGIFGMLIGGWSSNNKYSLLKAV